MPKSQDPGNRGGRLCLPLVRAALQAGDTGLPRAGTSKGRAALCHREGTGQWKDLRAAGAGLELESRQGLLLSIFVMGIFFFLF